MSVPTMHKFAEGYQAALADVLAVWEQGGEEAARTWILENLRDSDAK